jgi:O-antigen ligase/Tfp pilus assembly protein PilF
MNFQKIVSNAIVLAGFLVIPFIPFIVLSSSTFFPFIVGKNFAFRVIVEMMLAAYVVLAFIDPAYRPKKSYLLGALGGFIGIITLAAIFGENPTKSFWSNFERMEGVVTYFHLAAYFVVASTVLTVRGMWRPFLNLNLAAGVIMAAYGVLQWSGALNIVQDGVRVNGTLGNAAYLGAYALFNIFIAAFFLVRESFTTVGERVRVGIYGAIILLQTFVLYHTATRGAMLGLIAGTLLATVIIALFERKHTLIRKSAIGVLVALVLLVAGFVALRDAAFIRESPVLNRFATISFTEQTTKSRFMVWDMAIQGFKEKPVLGWGMENFNYVFNKYYNPNMWGQEQWFDRAHNVFFDWLIAGGLPGLLGYLSLFGYAVYAIWRRVKSLSLIEKAVLTGLLGGYFFQNLFVFDNITSLLLFFTILAFIESLSHDEEPLVEKKGVSEDVAFVVSGGAVIFAIVLIYMVNYSGYAQNRTLLRALSEKTQAGPAHNLELFKEAIAYQSYGTSEVREQLAQMAMSGFDKKKAVVPLQQKFIDLAGQELKIQAEKLPNDARYQIFAANFFNRVGASNEALPYALKAHELSPKKQTMLFEIGSTYYNLGDSAKTLEYFKQAYDLAPEYVDAENYYVSVLSENKNYGEVERILKEHLVRSPQELEPRLKLASTYIAMNRRADAVREIKTAIELNPEFQKQGEEYLRQIETGRI